VRLEFRGGNTQHEKQECGVKLTKSLKTRVTMKNSTAGGEEMSWFNRNEKWIVRFGLWFWLVFVFAVIIAIFEGVWNAFAFFALMGLFATFMLLMAILMAKAFGK